MQPLRCRLEFATVARCLTGGSGYRWACRRGVKIGRNLARTPHQQREAIKRRDQHEPVREIARTYNVSHSTITRLTA